jgi:hypothetical protein
LTVRFSQIITCAVLATLIVAPATAAAAGPTASSSKIKASAILTPSGFGSLRIGMTVRQARRATHEKIKVAKFHVGSCHAATTRQSGLELMLTGRRISRIEVYPTVVKRDVVTLGGIRLGSSEADVRAAFGSNVTELPHAYVPGGKYLTISYDSGKYKGKGIRFETDEFGVVTGFYAGKRREISYVEGCL